MVIIFLLSFVCAVALATQAVLNIDQQYLVELYKIIDKKQNSTFSFERASSQNFVEKAIDDAILYHKKNVDLSAINRNRIVIHGRSQILPGAQ